MLILECVIFSVKPGSELHFETGYESAKPHLRGAPGCRGVELRRGIENPSDYLLLVHWDRIEDHMEDFRKSESFLKWRAPIEPFMAAPPRMVHYGPVV
jgi:heme-degrading monooxygenase HmoA